MSGCAALCWSKVLRDMQKWVTRDEQEALGAGCPGWAGRRGRERGHTVLQEMLQFAVHFRQVLGRSAEKIVEGPMGRPGKFVCSEACLIPGGLRFLP